MQTTKDLLQRIQNGSETAREELFRRFEPGVKSLVRLKMGGFLRSKEQSDDMTQMALIRLLNRLDTLEYRSSAEFLGYLAILVDNAIRDRARYWEVRKKFEENLGKGRSSESTTSLYLLVDQFVSHIDSREDPAVLAEYAEDFDHLRQALEQLKRDKPEYWELIIAKEFGRLSYKEIAAERNTSPDAVKQKTLRAKEKLAGIFKALWGDPAKEEQ